MINEKLNRILGEVGPALELTKTITCQTRCMAFPAYNQYATTFGKTKFKKKNNNASLTLWSQEIFNSKLFGYSEICLETYIGP